MKVGDVVNFVSHSWVTDRDYPNPGIIHDICVKQSGHESIKPVIVATVLWSNASITNEYSCYLEVISESR